MQLTCGLNKLLSMWTVYHMPKREIHQSRLWLRKHKFGKMWQRSYDQLFGKRKQEDTGGRYVKLAVAISYGKGVFACHLDKKMAGGSFSTFIDDNVQCLNHCCWTLYFNTKDTTHARLIQELSTYHQLESVAHMLQGFFFPFSAVLV